MGRNWSKLHAPMSLYRSRQTVPQLVKKFPTFQRNRRFITPFSRDTSSHYSAPHQPSPRLPPISWRSILILSSHLCLSLFQSGIFPHQNPACTSPTPHSASYSTYLKLPYLTDRIIFDDKYRSWSSSTPLSPRTSWAQMSSSAPCSETPSAFVPPSI